MTHILLAIEVRRVRCKGCGPVKSGRLDFLADNPFSFVTAHQHIGELVAGLGRQLAQEEIVDEQEIGGAELRAAPVEVLEVFALGETRERRAAVEQT